MRIHHCPLDGVLPPVPNDRDAERADNPLHRHPPDCDHRGRTRRRRTAPGDRHRRVRPGARRGHRCRLGYSGRRGTRCRQVDVGARGCCRTGWHRPHRVWGGVAEPDQDAGRSDRRARRARFDRCRARRDRDPGHDRVRSFRPRRRRLDPDGHRAGAGGGYGRSGSSSRGGSSADLRRQRLGDGHGHDRSCHQGRVHRRAETPRAHGRRGHHHRG